ncbi:MAG: diguanylate cyclase [Bacillota bacterium]|nr:diguanylate cyclase [Bacillota bacterium]
MNKSGEFSLIKKETLLSLMRVSITLLALLIFFTIVPMDFGTYYVWFVFLVPLGLYMSLISLSQVLERHKNTNTNLLLHIQIALFYLLTVVLIIFTGGVESSYKVILLLPVLFYSLEFGSRWGFGLTGMALKDELTGLFNLRFFNYKLKRLIEKANGEYKVGLILIELDKYSKFKESWGFCAGSIILKNISKSLLSVTGKNDFAVHYEGGKFVVITRAGSFAQVIGKAEKLRKKLHLDLGRGMEDDWKLPSAVGVSIFPDHAESCSGLLQKADDALQRAIIIGGSRAQVYYSVFDRISGKMDREFLNYVKAMMASIRERDRFIYGHSERVLIYSQLICRRLRLPPKKAMIIEYAAFLHDIGKVEINREISKKKGPLQHWELEKYKQHPVSGAEMLLQVKQMRRIIPFIMHHHERYDGSGYPSGIKGSEIPLGSRIIAVADFFDSITAERAYGRGKTMKEGICSLQQKKTTYLDPMVVDAFVNALSDYEDISHIMEWPKDLSRIVPSGSRPNNYILGGHYADYYSGEIHFLIKAVHCIAAGVANNEKCIYMVDERKEEDMLRQFKKYLFDANQLERVSFPDSLLKMKKDKANIEFETKKVIKTWLDNAEKEHFDSIRLIIDHTFLNLRQEELSSWEKMLTRCIKNLDVVIVCYYDFEAMHYQADIINVVHDRPLVIPTDIVKEMENAR